MSNFKVGDYVVLTNAALDEIRRGTSPSNASDMGISKGRILELLDANGIPLACVRWRGGFRGDLITPLSVLERAPTEERP
jgi:hypothetical protein